MKYKIGDKVRIKSADWYIDNKNNYGNIEFADGYVFTLSMSKYCGKILTIEYCYTDDNHNPFYGMKENMHEWTKASLTMETLTKKDLLEAIEDMPMDADIYIASDHPMWTLASYTETNETENTIKIC